MFESLSPIGCRTKARWGVMKITVGSEEAQLLGKSCKCFSSNPPQVNDLNRVAGGRGWIRPCASATERRRNILDNLALGKAYRPAYFA